MLICGYRNLNYQGIFCKRYRRVGAMPSQKIETGHQDVVHDVARDYFGDRMATASSDTTIKIIGVGSFSHQHLVILSCHQGPVW